VQFKAVKQVNMTHFGRLKLSSITEYTVFKNGHHFLFLRLLSVLFADLKNIWQYCTLIIASSWESKWRQLHASPTGARVSFEIDANPMSFHKMGGRGLKQRTGVCGRPERNSRVNAASVNDLSLPPRA